MNHHREIGMSVFAGLDVSLAAVAICIVDEQGRVAGKAKWMVPRTLSSLRWNRGRAILSEPASRPGRARSGSVDA